jgi:hypothetical protein
MELLVNPLNPHLGALACPSTPEVIQTKEHTPTSTFIIFTFGLVVESTKELGDVSQNLIQKLVFLKILESKQKNKDFSNNIVYSFINYGIKSKILLLAFFFMIGDLNSIKTFEFCKRIIVEIQ